MISPDIDGIRVPRVFRDSRTNSRTLTRSLGITGTLDTYVLIRLTLPRHGTGLGVPLTHEVDIGIVEDAVTAKPPVQPKGIGELPNPSRRNTKLGCHFIGRVGHDPPPLASYRIAIAIGNNPLTITIANDNI